MSVIPLNDAPAAEPTSSPLTTVEVAFGRRVVEAFRVSGSPVHVLAVCDDGTVWDCIVSSKGDPTEWRQCVQPIPTE